METSNRWQDKLNLALGIWLLISPFVLVSPYSPIQFDLVTTHSLIMGLVIALAAGATLLQFKVWEEWTEVGLGIWMVASPFILGFSDMTFVMLNYVIVGLVIIVDSTWVLSEHPPTPHAT